MQTIEKPLSENIERIAKEAAEAGCTKWDILKMVKELQSESSGNLNELRDKAIECLEKINPKASAVYASFNRMHVITSDEKIEAFDRGNIIKSLLKETTITRGIAEKIGREVEDKIKDLNIKNLNTALIRNLVNVKLLEYGHENIYHQYCRIGMPAFEVTEKLNKEMFENKEILKEYHWQNVIADNFRDYHFEADINIDKIEDFSTKPIYNSVFITEKFQNVEELLAALVKELNLVKHFSSYVPAVVSANFMFGELIDKYSKKKMKYLANSVAEIIESFQTNREKPLLSIDLFARDAYEKKSAKEKALSLGNEILKNCIENQRKVDLAVCVDSKYKLKLLDKEILKRNSIRFVNCWNEEVKPLPCGHSTLDEGVMIDIAINLPKIALTSQNNRSQYIKALKEILADAVKLYETKIVTMENKGYVSENVKLKRFKPALSLYGFMESARLIVGEDGKECITFAENLIDEMTKILSDKWNLCELNNSSITERFANYNRREFDYEFVSYENKAEQMLKSPSLRKRITTFFYAGSQKELEDLLAEKADNVVF